MLSSTVAKYRLADADPFLDSPLPFPFPFCCQGEDVYCPFSTLGFCVASVRILEDLPWCFEGFISRSRISFESCGRGSVVISCITCQPRCRSLQAWKRSITSKDCAYQSWTLLIDGISFNPSGRSPSSCTLCASRMGSSSDKNWDARKRVPDQPAESVQAAWCRFVLCIIKY
mgnify:CR=1 FL=1